MIKKEGIPTHRQKILVIDDEENYRQIISLALQLNGFEIIEAVNGLEGLAAAKEHQSDLILCDINMPTMDGHELLTALKEEKKFAGIPFIFLTGNSGPGEIRTGMQLGADDYLTKPFTGEELIEAVETRLSKKLKIQHYYESQFEEIKTSIVQSLPHEFRTPLSGILGYSQILQDESNLPDEEVKNIGSLIHASGTRLHHLLENMVLFGQIQIWMKERAEFKELHREHAASLKDVILPIAARLTASYDRADAVRVDLQDGNAQISPVHLTKIMEEVIDNALKFSEAGTTVNISCEEDHSGIHIIVRDEGSGMTPEQIKKISAFQQFERAYYEQQGAGLGMTIAKTLLELYGGRLTIVSAERKGTTVTVDIPKSKHH